MKLFNIIHTNSCSEELVKCSYFSFQGYLGRNYFIATQSPLRNTISDFWRMVHSQKSSTIVLLNSVKDGTVYCWQNYIYIDLFKLIFTSSVVVCRIIHPNRNINYHYYKLSISICKKLDIFYCYLCRCFLYTLVVPDILADNQRTTKPIRQLDSTVGLRNRIWWNMDQKIYFIVLSRMNMISNIH
jgi:hypothetical protein